MFKITDAFVQWRTGNPAGFTKDDERGARAREPPAVGLCPLKLKVFLSIFTQERGQKSVRDISTPCPRQTASRSHDEPLILVNRGGRLIHPCLDPPLHLSFVKT